MNKFEETRDERKKGQEWMWKSNLQMHTNCSARYTVHSAMTKILEAESEVGVKRDEENEGQKGRRKKLFSLSVCDFEFYTRKRKNWPPLVLFFIRTFLPPWPTRV